MRLSEAWQYELRRALVLFAAAAGLGLYGGYVLASLLIASLAYIAYTLYRIHLLARWACDAMREPLPELSGPLGVVHDRLFRIDRQRRKRKKRLRRASDELRLAADATPDATVLLGQNDEILWVNHAATELLGLRDDEDRDQPIGNLLRNPEFVAYLESGDFNESLEMNAPVSEGIRLLVRLVSYARNRRLLIARNVSHQYRLEQMRKDFVANVSHELRSPLTVIVGYLETLADHPDAPELWRKPVEQMGQQAGRMCLIVEDLLKLSRLEADPNSASDTPIDVVELIESISRDAGALGGGQQRIHVEAQSRDTLLGEYNELVSAFANLVFNAVQYTPAGGSITLRWEHREDGSWVVSVTDTGIGIDPADIPRLTERFYRVDKARSRDLGGTGLGLAIVKHVLARHGAWLDITSEVGEGSCFSCVFPSTRVIPASSEAQPPALAAAAGND